MQASMLQFGRVSFAFYYLYKAVHAVAQEFPSSQEVIQGGSQRCLQPAAAASRTTAVYGLYAYALHCLQSYRVNDDSPAAANDSNFFHPRSPLGCWLVYFTLESGRMFIFQSTSAESLGLAHRTPEVRSNTG